MNDLNIHISQFKGVTDTAPKQVDLSWSELCDLLSQPPTTGEKTASQALSFAEYGAGETRGNAGVVQMHGFIFDVDDGSDPFDIALNLSGVEHFIYTSYSHGVDGAVKFRVLVPLAKPIDPLEYRDQLTAFASEHEIPMDPSCKDPGRLFFYGSAAKPKAFEHYIGHGEPARPVEVESVSHETSLDDDLDWRSQLHLRNGARYSKEDVESMLTALPADEYRDSHDNWLSTVFAVQANFARDPDTAFELIDRWSCESESYDVAEIRNMIYREPKNLVNPTTIGTLVRFAQASGWKRPNPITPAELRYPFNRITEASLTDIPPVEWLVHNLLTEHDVTMLSGPGSAGKSMLLMQLGCAVATGQSFLNRHTNQRPVLYLNGEDSFNKFRRRLSNYLPAASIDPNALKDTFFYLGAESKLHKLTDDSGNINDKEISLLARAIKPLCAGLSPVVMIDPISKVRAGDENSSTAASSLIQAFQHLAVELDNATLIYGHHEGKAQARTTGTAIAGRGSSAYFDDARQAMRMVLFGPDANMQMFAQLTGLEAHDLRDWDDTRYRRYVGLVHAKPSEGELQDAVLLERNATGQLFEAAPIERLVTGEVESIVRWLEGLDELPTWTLQDLNAERISTIWPGERVTNLEARRRINDARLMGILTENGPLRLVR